MSINVPKPPARDDNTGQSHHIQFRLHDGNSNRPREKDAIDVMDAFLSEGWVTRDIMCEALIALGEKHDKNFRPAPPAQRLTRELWEAVRALVKLSHDLASIDLTQIASTQTRQAIVDTQEHMKAFLDTTEMTDEGDFFE